VTHSGPIRALITIARGNPLTEWRHVRVTHTGLRTIRITPKVLERWGAFVDTE